MRRVIDLNCDLGEGFGAWQIGDDEAMLDLVTSANIACGFHAGDPEGLLRTLKAAKARGRAIGAHVSYPDLVGFGRRAMSVPYEALKADVLYQIGALSGLARSVGAQVAYVKPHGALYHAMSASEATGAAVIDAIVELGGSRTLVAPANAPVLDAARRKGLNTVAELFADRAYRSDGSLLPRSEAGAVLHDADTIASRMVGLMRDGVLDDVDGRPLKLDGGTICVHGDNPSAVVIARHLRDALVKNNVEISAFAQQAQVAA